MPEQNQSQNQNQNPPTDPNVKKQPAKDQAERSGKVDLEKKANPTKPQEVQGKNVNRP